MVITSSYQAIHDVPDDTSLLCKGCKCGKRAKTATVHDVLSQTISGKLSKTYAVTAIAVISVYITLMLLGCP